LKKNEDNFMLTWNSGKNNIAETEAAEPSRHQGKITSRKSISIGMNLGIAKF